MFHPYNSTRLRVATVTAVDLKRKVAKCIGDTGETFKEVFWAVGYKGNPEEGDRVLVDTSTGTPIITGILPSDVIDDIERQNITLQSSETVDVSDYSVVDVDAARGESPKDINNGDLIQSNRFGMFGLLRLGTFIAKSSSLAQVVVSRWGDLVRIVSRNFDHFTEVDSVQKNSIRGRLYAKKSLYRNPVDSRAENPSMVEYEGAVAIGEALEAIGSPRSIPLDQFPEDPEDDGIFKKTSTFKEGILTSVKESNVDGSFKRTIIGESNSLETNHTSDGFTGKLTTDNGEISMQASPEGFKLDVANVNITIDMSGNLSITTGDSATLDIAGDLTVNSNAMTFAAQSDISIHTPANVTIAGAQIHWNKP